MKVSISMEIINTQVFSFKTKVGETNYSFNVTAPSQEEAKQLLLTDLNKLIALLDVGSAGEDAAVA